MSRSLFQSLVWRMGFRLASKQIEKTLTRGTEPDELTKEADQCLWKRLSADMSFEAGYNAAWSHLGETDVKAGLCRAAKFRSHGYNLGWQSQFNELSKAGWENTTLKREAELLRKHYWENIGKGSSDEYYEVLAERK